jgi:hypothetical protein
VVDLLAPAGVGGEGKGVGRRHQVDGPTMSVRDLVGVHRSLALEVDHSGDLDARSGEVIDMVEQLTARHRLD